MDVDKNKIKEEAKKAIAAIKDFSQKHELGKKIKLASLIVLSKVFDSWAKRDSFNNEEDYYQLLDDHDNLYISDDPDKHFKIEVINNKLRNKKHPKEEEYKSLSDERVDEEFQNVCNESNDIWDKLDKKHSGSFDKMVKDPSYSSYIKHRSNADQLEIERQRRYKEKNPDKFPRSREHGFNLYKKKKD